MLSRLFESHRYNTEKVDGQWRGAQFRVPEHSISSSTSLLDGLKVRPREAFPVIASHVLVGLVHDQVGPYGPVVGKSGQYVLIGFSAAVLMFGVAGLMQMIYGTSLRIAGSSLGSLLALSVLYTAFVATESRFGILGFYALSFGAANWLASNAWKRSALVLILASMVGWLLIGWHQWLMATRVVV